MSMKNATEPWSHARQKLWEAMQSLVSSKPMRFRLASALVSLEQLNVETEIPPERRVEFERLRQELRDRRVALDPERMVVSSLAPKSDEYARQILRLFVEVMGGL